MRTILLCAIIIGGISFAHSQTIIVQPSLQLKGKFKSNKLWLRWVVYDQDQWYTGLSKGYTLKRFLIDQDRRAMEWSKHILPVSKQSWVRTRDSMSITETLYDLLYLSDEALIKEMPVKSDGSAYDYTVQEIRETRYLLSLRAANQNFQASFLQGVGYEDQDISRNRAYEYVIVADKDSFTLRFDPKSSAPALLPIRPEYQIDDVGTYLRWESKSRYDTYHSYQIELSKDGNRYTSISSDPVHNYVENKIEKGYRDHYFWHDSIYPGLHRWYRLRGMDYFGELNNPGPAIQIRYPVRIPAPIAIDYESTSQGVQLNWYFPVEFETQISHFQLWMADSSQGPKKLIQDQIIRTQRAIMIDAPTTTLFYSISLVRIEGNSINSFPIMVTPIDNTPPASPQNLMGYVDSVGQVYLSWPPIKARDLQGYRIFKANNIHDEYSQLTYEPIHDTIYTDSIDLNNLNNYIYYKIAAEDLSGNMSELSTPVEITKFDRIAPSSPQIYKWIPDEGSIQLYWHPSSSSDVKYTTLLRKSYSLATWEVLQSTEPSEKDNFFIDDDIHPDSLYTYSLITVDHSGNASDRSESVTARALGILKYPAIEQFKIVYDSSSVAALLSWSYPVDQVSEFWIYRSENTEPLTLLLTLDQVIHAWTDTNVGLGKTYTYRIKALMANGRDSYFSAAVLVQVE